MSKFVPKIEIKPGIPPIYNDEIKPPSDHMNFGPDDTANAVKVLVEACKLWPDDFVRQIESVDISWVGYFQPCYRFIIMHNANYTNAWHDKIVLESRFQTPREAIELGSELAKQLLEKIDFFYRHFDKRETLLSQIVRHILGEVTQPCPTKA